MRLAMSFLIQDSGLVVTHFPTAAIGSVCGFQTKAVKELNS